MGTPYNVSGFLPEPDSDKHWGYEDKLKSRMKAIATGDIDLRQYSSPRHNQGGTGSCVGQSVVKALEVKRIMQHGLDAHVDLSVMMVYYLARELMFPPRTSHDSGTHISLACDVLRRFGVAPEADWPFDPSKLFENPPWKAMRNAYMHRIESFFKIRSTGQDRVDEVVRCLQAGNPVVYGTTVGNNWFGYRKGQVLKCPKTVEGRHATCLLGVKDGKFLGENSWGTRWGDDGYYEMDPEVICSDDSRDFWVIQAGFEEYTS